MNILSLIKDDTGAFSSMRAAMLIIIVPIMLVWTFLSIHNGEFVNIPWETMTILLGALGVKAAQSVTEKPASTPSQPANQTPNEK